MQIPVEAIEGGADLKPGNSVEIEIKVTANDGTTIEADVVSSEVIDAEDPETPPTEDPKESDMPGMEAMGAKAGMAMPRKKVKQALHIIIAQGGKA